MSDYNKSTNFTTKDTLPTGNSGKIVKGTELDIEFTAIASAIASKANSDSPDFTGVPTAPTATLGTNTTQLATTAYAMAAGLPSGCIVLWSGSIASIPSGWLLCNGSSSTPDLRNRFVVGAGSTYAVAATGGSADAIVVSHTHSASTSISDPGHQHSYRLDVNGASVAFVGNQGNLGGATLGTGTGSGESISSGTQSSTTGISASTSITSSGGSATNANLPPYYALAYIMKS